MCLQKKEKKNGGVYVVQKFPKFDLTAIPLCLFVYAFFKNKVVSHPCNLLDIK